MIDLHSHILPGIDDGAHDDAEAVAMARMAVAEGVTVQACTPHFFPGVFDNAGLDVRERVARLQALLDAEGVPLRLVVGGDVHVAPDITAKLRSGQLLSLNDTRYVLIEPPHHVLPPRIDEFFFNLRMAGYVPILTHPERMSWIEERYDLIRRLAANGVWMQLTAGALVGHFGRRAQYWSERMLDEDLVQIVASDAHNTHRRPPLIAAAFEALCGRVGEEEAWRLLRDRPQGIIADACPETLFTGGSIPHQQQPLPQTFWKRLLAGVRGQ